MPDNLKQYIDFFSGLLHLVEGTADGSQIGAEQLFSLCMKELDGIRKKNGRTYWIGNGGSASIAAHMAIDFTKNTGLASISFNEASLLTCLSNDYGYEHSFAKAVEMYMEPGDMLIAISSSGKSMNIVNAASMAHKKGCRVLGMSGFSSGNPLREISDFSFYVPDGRYGMVELAHSLLAHALLDLMVERYPQADGR